VNVDDLVSELLNEFTRLQRRESEAHRRFEQIRRRLKAVEASRDRWRDEAKGLRFQLSQKNSVPK
jgi:hypothetical protein